MSRYDIIIVSCGKPELTAACFESIARHSDCESLRVIWVDNKPEESCPPHNDLPTMCFPMPENIGYIKAVNLGIAISTAPYVILLNNDTRIQTQAWMAKMAVMLDPYRTPQVGAVCPRLVNPHTAEPPTSENEIVDYELLKGHGLSFACCMVSREALRDVGYLDERFCPMYGEDDDWFQRAKIAGWQIARCNDVTVFHQVSATTWRYSENYRMIRATNTEKLKEKYGLS